MDSNDNKTQNYTPLTGEWVLALLELEKEGRLENPEIVAGRGGVERGEYLPSTTELQTAEENAELSEVEEETGDDEKEEQGTNEDLQNKEILPKLDPVTPMAPVSKKTFPMSDAEIFANQKKASYDSGATWLAYLYHKLLKASGFELKTDKDKNVIRVPLKKDMSPEELDTSNDAP